MQTDCIEASHDTLLKEGRAALQGAHDNLTACVMKMSLEKEQQIETIQAQLESVLQPVDRMKMPDGTTVEVDVAAEIEAFKQLLAEEESNLEVKWDDWECLQEEIAMLGIQILGEEVRDMLPEVLFRRVNEEQTGYKADSKKWLEELDEALAGPMEEVRAAGEEALKKFVAAEKVCIDKKTKRRWNEANGYDRSLTPSSTSRRQRLLLRLRWRRMIEEMRTAYTRLSMIWSSKSAVGRIGPIFWSLNARRCLLVVTA